MSMTEWPSAAGGAAKRSTRCTPGSDARSLRPGAVDAGRMRPSSWKPGTAGPRTRRLAK